MKWWEWIPTALILAGVLAGIGESILHSNLGPKLNEWPKRNVGRLPRDSHAQARLDGRFVDGMITGATLDDLDDMFK